MGNKQSAEEEKVEPGSATFQRTSSLALAQKKAEEVVFGSNGVKNDRLRKEQTEINLVLKEKQNILKTGIQLRAKQNMDKGINKQAWDFIENKKISEQIELEMIAFDLSNSKVYEMLCNSLKTASFLRELILVNCNLTLFPKFLPMSLVKLDLRENLIPKIVFEYENESLGKNEKPEINYFDLSSNRIEEIPFELPQSITYLLLQKNLITKALKQSFEDLNSLQTLNLSGNQIEKVEFTTKIFTCLYDLNLSFNKIKTLPANFFYPSKTLVNFSLSNNPLQVLENSISEMQTLQRLDLRSTKLTKLPTGLSMLTRLEKLLIENVFLVEPPMFVVKKGKDEIMRYLRRHHIESSRTEKDYESPKDSEEEKPIEEEKTEIIENTVDFESPSLGKSLSKNEKIKLSKQEFLALNSWINNLKVEKLEDFLLLQDFLVDTLNDPEVDIDKTFFTLNAISKMFSQYMKGVKTGTKMFEISASSSYFLGRIGEYPRAVKFLNDIGFQLISKPFIGLMLTLKSSNANFQKLKVFHEKLEDMLVILKECRIKEQFVPDYHFKRN